MVVSTFVFLYASCAEARGRVGTGTAKLGGSHLTRDPRKSRGAGLESDQKGVALLQ